MHHRSIHFLYIQQVSQAKFCPSWHLWNDWWKSCLPDCDTRSIFLTDLRWFYDPPLLYSSTDFIMVRDVRNSKNRFLGKVVHNCHWLCTTDKLQLLWGSENPAHPFHWKVLWHLASASFLSQQEKLLSKKLGSAVALLLAKDCATLRKVRNGSQAKFWHNSTN